MKRLILRYYSIHGSLLIIIKTQEILVPGFMLRYGPRKRS